MEAQKLEGIAYRLIFLGIGFGVFAFLIFLSTSQPWAHHGEFDTQTFSEYGEFIAGTVGVLFSLVGVLLLIQNLRDQNKNFVIQQIERRLFELIKIQRDNSECAVIEGETRNISGKKLFIYMLEEYHQCFARVKTLQAKYKLEDDQVINLAYVAFFYGTIGKLSYKILGDRLSKIHGRKFVEDLFKLFLSNRFYKPKQKEIEIPYTRFKGHQSRLGHYYRHYFQSIKYINEQESLTYDQKYKYVKILRAQLSTHEQALFFVNSISEIGRKWELDNRDENFRLITKYNLIKNIPDGLIEDISFRDYYPNVFYEVDKNESPERKELIKVYKQMPKPSTV